MEIKLCSVKNYYQLAERGFFYNVRVELIEGVIVHKPPLKPSEATAICLANEELRKIFGANYVYNIRMPLLLSDFSEPTPEIYIVKGKVRDFTDSHPKTAELIVEVSQTTLNYDRTKKASLYAENRIADYWILNLKDRCLEVYRQPKKDKNLGFIYGEINIFTETESIAPLAAPKSKIKIADILP